MKHLWISFALVIVVSFTVLGWIGTRIYQEAPPIAATGHLEPDPPGSDEWQAWSEAIGRMNSC